MEMIFTASVYTISGYSVVTANHQAGLLTVEIMIVISKLVRLVLSEPPIGVYARL